MKESKRCVTSIFVLFRPLLYLFAQVGTQCRCQPAYLLTLELTVNVCQSISEDGSILIRETREIIKVIQSVTFCKQLPLSGLNAKESNRIVTEWLAWY